MKKNVSTKVKISAHIVGCALLFINLFMQKVVGQTTGFTGVNVSYLGEMVTHPGIKVGVDYGLSAWSKVKAEGKERERKISKSIVFSPSLGSFYHKRYQTGFFIIPELKYLRVNPKGFYYDLGIGLGYLRTVIPNVYEISPSGDINKVQVGYDYLSSLCFITLGRSINRQNDNSMSLFVKPQFMYAIPNFTYGTGYFFLELGVNLKIKET
ncbi:MAG: hypothetical protein CMP59_05135 [Flavobacteriales bacterium]|nr:hypothetical protein [Flavobacteriales bacterium]|tara:strand:+ start:47 stop:676 length:630 start_codon:yes stop_codon:yes gene_type:complete